MMPAAGINPKRENTKPLSTRVEILEDKANELEKGLDECQDVKAKMDVLDERTQTLVTQSNENRGAIFGTGPKDPGLITRMSNFEIKMDEINKFIGEVKKVGYGVLIAVLGIFIELLIQLILSHGQALAK